MANRRDRGQLILITGLVIAVLLVAMVLILNSAIYTENVATRGVDKGGNDAIDFRNTVVEGAEEIIEKENNGGDEGLEDRVNTSIERYVELISDHHIENAKIAEADPEIKDGNVTIRIRYQTPELLYEETVILPLEGS